MIFASREWNGMKQNLHLIHLKHKVKKQYWLLEKNKSKKWKNNQTIYN